MAQPYNDALFSGPGSAVAADNDDSTVSAQGTADLSTTKPSPVQLLSKGSTVNVEGTTVPETIDVLHVSVDNSVADVVANVDNATIAVDNTITEEIAITPPPGADLDAPLTAAQGRSPRYRNWVFTFNNYTDGDLTRITTLFNDKKQIRYAIIGKEVAPSTGTPHLQGYITFVNQIIFTRLKELIGNSIWCAPAKGPAWTNYEYCSKSNSFEEFGDTSNRAKTGEKRKSGTQGCRADLKEFTDHVDGLEVSAVDKRVLRREFPLIYAKYPRFFESTINDHINVLPEIKLHTLRKWQGKLYQDLQHAPNDRQIVFVVDYQGDCGKSWFAKYYRNLHPNTWIMVPGKKADMAFAFPMPAPRVVFMDAPRSKQNEFLQYDFLEEMKNGYVFSSKYESVAKEFDPPHVVVLMNQMPDPDKLSADRYKIIEITENDLKPV